MRSVSFSVVLSVCALAPLAAHAADVKLGVDLGATYNSNVFSSSTNPEDDINGFVGPRLIVDDQTGTFRWNLRYSPRYRRYVQLHELNAWDQDAQGGFSWDLGERTLLQVDARYFDYRNFLQQFTQDLLPDGSIDTGVAFNREEFKQKSLSVSLHHSLAERHLVIFSADYYDNRFDEELAINSTHSRVATVSGSYYYTLRPRDSVGAGLSVTRQTIKGSDDFNTDFVNLSLLWKHQFSRTFDFDVSVGPTWTRQDPVDRLEVLPKRAIIPTRVNPDGTLSPFHGSTCPQFSDGTHFLGEGCRPFAEDEISIPPFTTLPPLLAGVVTDLPRQGRLPGDSSALTYFAQVSLTKTWEESRLVLSYVRDATTATQNAGSVRDNYSASFSWTPFRSWTFGLYTYYETREIPAGNGVNYVVVIDPDAATDVARSVAFRAVPLKDQIRTKAYVASLNANYQWSDRIELYWSAIWTTQKVDNPFGGSSKFDGFSTTVGMIYWLPTFQLPF